MYIYVSIYIYVYLCISMYLYISIYIYIYIVTISLYRTLINGDVNASLQESKLYGAHFKEITADAPKSTKITFNDSDDED